MVKAVHKFAYRSVGSVVFLASLSFLIGCSQQTVAKPQESASPQRAEARQEKKAIPARSSQDSSLDALQKGTLGQGAGGGPLRDINFDYDRADLRSDAREILKTNATWLKTNPQAKVEIEGHCDERGTNEYNLALGAKRAESVKRYLIDLGVSSSRLSTVSYGEELPLCKGQDETCWGKNRRAHFAVKSAPTA